MITERPEYDRVKIGRVNPHSGRIRPHQLRLCVSNQSQRLFSAQFLGGILVDRRTLVTRGMNVRSRLFHFGFVNHRIRFTCCHSRRTDV